MAEIPNIALNTGTEIPQLGFGVFQVPPEDTAEAVAGALETGYRHIDTASAYRNERGVGEAIAASGIRREQLFVTTKLWNDEQADPERAFEASLRRLGFDYVDLYLIHWPAPAAGRYVDAWRTLERFAADGRARAIGVSNFHASHLERLLAETETTPALNQVELHPLLAQAELRRFHAEHGIVTEAWSPLARGGALLEHPTIAALAEQHGKTPAQVVLRWHVELGNVTIPKSVTPSRVAENIDVFDFALGPEGLAAIAELDEGSRTGPHPDEFG